MGFSELSCAPAAAADANNNEVAGGGDGGVAAAAGGRRWPAGHPLPLPRWRAAPAAALALRGGLAAFEALAARVELQLRRLLVDRDYDTVGNFVDFHAAYGRRGAGAPVDAFFRSYVPRITAEHHTCVGLALELWQRLRRLEGRFPGLAAHLYVASCEENIESVAAYTACGDLEASKLEKEHVLLCLRFEFSGRSGVLLCDPGYHVARVVTVMADRAYPNTGWFVQSEENNIRKEYNYQFSSSKESFVEWQEKTTRNNAVENFTGLIYVEKPYLTSVDVTERRNLVYNFRSLLSRDQKGHLIAGIYFKVKLHSDEFTIFYQDGGKQREKMNFSDFRSLPITEELQRKVDKCNEQLNIPNGKLLGIIRTCGEILSDTKFVQECLSIEEAINVMSANN